MGHYTPDPRRRGIVLPDEIERDDPTPVDGVRLVASDVLPADTALVFDSAGKPLARIVGIDHGHEVPMPVVFTIGGRSFTVGQEITWRRSRWVVEGPDKRTSRSGRPCVKLRGYRYAVDAKEIET